MVGSARSLASVAHVDREIEGSPIVFEAGVVERRRAEPGFHIVRPVLFLISRIFTWMPAQGACAKAVDETFAIKSTAIDAARRTSMGFLFVAAGRCAAIGSNRVPMPLFHRFYVRQRTEHCVATA